jgi:hypothetical protein
MSKSLKFYYTRTTDDLTWETAVVILLKATVKKALKISHFLK